jgi:hypothetical protein
VTVAPFLHPAAIAMIEAAGSSAGEYVAATGGVTSYRTRSDIGDASSRLIPMPGLPAHTAGTTHRDEIMMSVELAPNLRFLTGTPGEGASILMDEGLLPETIGAALEGRHVSEVVDHPMLRVEGLEIVKAESAHPPHRGKVRLRLSALRWRRV